jgi:hypothetical protein
MSLPSVLNTPVTLAVAFTLAGAPGSVDNFSPITWSLTPPENGTIVPAGDGMTAVATMTVLGDTAISVTADANLAAGILDLVVSDTIQTVEAIALGADGGVISVV